MPWYASYDEKGKKSFLAKKGIPNDEWEEAVFSATLPLKEAEDLG